MINGLGVVGWGVGGIEAEAVMLGQPLFMLTPQVIGLPPTRPALQGRRRPDLVRQATPASAQEGASSTSSSSSAVRAWRRFRWPIARDRSPTWLPSTAPPSASSVDDATLEYLRATGRSANDIELVERYNRARACSCTDDSPEPVFTDLVELDPGHRRAKPAGPKRLQDRPPPPTVKSAFQSSSPLPSGRGFALSAADLKKKATVAVHGGESVGRAAHGAVIIAAITNCAIPQTRRLP